jgi:hypothetical protein
MSGHILANRELRSRLFAIRAAFARYGRLARGKKITGAEALPLSFVLFSAGNF